MITFARVYLAYLVCLSFSTVFHKFFFHKFFCVIYQFRILLKQNTKNIQDF